MPNKFKSLPGPLGNIIMFISTRLSCTAFLRMYRLCDVCAVVDLKMFCNLMYEVLRWAK